jgi:hypothetical protein
MKVYVAAKFEERDEVLKLYEILKSKGHTVTCDWTKHKSISPYKDNPELAREYSIGDTNGSMDADFFIMLTPNDGKGMFVELGAAIASNIKSGKPKIYAVGENNTETIFYFHPSVTRVDTLDEVLKQIG